ncbi:MAG: iron-sulfur cluster assembly scaffold protein [Alphaproteobacteria bacterium]|nr:iron-sulfur cluster assembly scaffold protein [Alphaproteobacteria bacterium]
MIDELYSAKILTLVANMPRAGRLTAPDASAEKTAKLCGSRITVDVVLEKGRVSDFAQDVAACALGQASAAILGANIIGADLSEIELARDSLRAMLKTNGSPPAGRFSELAVLEPVKAYPARHASTLLAFEAAVEAVSRATAATETRTSRAGAA